ncbi:MAG: methyltransferase domain-containing protein [Bacteroidota bacterium]|nr:methyltransferase domain-containing protein [Bacteroidota bacterium]
MKKIDWKYIISFFAGSLVKEIQSPINGILKVYYINGKYILNAADTNYSFGELHKGFQKIFKKIKLEEKQFENVLLLGFGTGSVVSIIQEEMNRNCSFVAIEKDKDVLELGNEFFKVSRFKNLKIIETDAFDFVKNCNKKFDLVIFDIYINNKIPSQFETEDFFKSLKKVIAKNGNLVYNKDINSKAMKSSLVNLENLFSKFFSGFQKIQVVKNNWFYVFDKKSIGK